MKKKSAVAAAVASVALGGTTILTVPAYAGTTPSSLPHDSAQADDADSSPSKEADLGDLDPNIDLDAPDVDDDFDEGDFDNIDDDFHEGDFDEDLDVAEEIRNDLADLVKDGTISAEQADAVADTLAATIEGEDYVFVDGGPNLQNFEEVFLPNLAQTLGITQKQLLDGLDDDLTLAAIAARHGINRQDATTTLIAAGQAQLTAAVEDGQLTTQKAEEMKKKLPDRVEKMLDRTLGDAIERPRHGGPHHGGRHKDHDKHQN